MSYLRCHLLPVLALCRAHAELDCEPCRQESCRLRPRLCAALSREPADQTQVLDKEIPTDGLSTGRGARVGFCEDQCKFMRILSGRLLDSRAASSPRKRAVAA